jgi:hypothetical protein
MEQGLVIDQSALLSINTPGCPEEERNVTNTSDKKIKWSKTAFVLQTKLPLPLSQFSKKLDIFQMIAWRIPILFPLRPKCLSRDIY